MTLEEYIDSLIDQGFSEEEINEKVKQYRENGNVVPEAEEIIESKEADFPTSSATGAGVLRVNEPAPFTEDQQLLMSEELTFPKETIEVDTELPLVDTSSDSQDPDPKEEYKTPEILALEKQLEEAKKEYNTDFSGKEFSDYTRKIREIEDKIAIETKRAFSGGVDLSNPYTLANISEQKFIEIINKEFKGAVDIQKTPNRLNFAKDEVVYTNPFTKEKIVINFENDSKEGRIRTANQIKQLKKTFDYDFSKNEVTSVDLDKKDVLLKESIFSRNYDNSPKQNAESLNFRLKGTGYTVEGEFRGGERQGSNETGVNDYKIYKNGELISTERSFDDTRNWFKSNISDEDFKTTQNNIYAAYSDLKETLNETNPSELKRVEESDNTKQSYLSSGTFIDNLFSELENESYGLSGDEIKEIKTVLKDNIAKGFFSKQSGAPLGMPAPSKTVSTKEMYARYTNLGGLSDDLKNKINPEVLEEIYKEGYKKYAKGISDSNIQTIWEGIVDASGQKNLIASGTILESMEEADVENSFKDRADIISKAQKTQSNVLGSMLEDLATEAKGVNVGYSMEASKDTGIKFTWDDSKATDKEAAKKLFSKWQKIQKTYYQFSDEQELAIASLNSDYLKYIDKTSNPGITPKQILNLTSKTYNPGNILANDISTALYGTYLALPTAFGGKVSKEKAIEEQKMLDNRQSAYETQLTYKQALDQGRFGFFATRTGTQQSVNVAMAMSTSYLGAGLKVAPWLSRLAVSAEFGVSSGAQKSRNLNILVDNKEEAEESLKALKNLYDNKLISNLEYQNRQAGLHEVIAMGDMTDNQILLSSWGTGLIEAGVSYVAGTNVNAQKVIKDLAIKQGSKNVALGGSSVNILSFFERNGLEKFGIASKEWGKRALGELTEEGTILVGDVALDSAILGRDFDLSELDDTLVTALITTGGMNTPSIMYNSLMTNALTKKHEETFRLPINRISNITNSLKDPSLSPTVKENLKAQLVQETKDLGFVVAGIEIDALALNGENHRRLIGLEFFKQQRLAEAGVKAGDTKEVVDQKIDNYITSLRRTGKNNQADGFSQDLKQVEDSQKLIKQNIDYSIVEENLGDEGEKIKNRWSQKSNKSKISKKYKAADQRGKLALILEEIRRTTVNGYVNKAKNDDNTRDRVESMTYTDGISKGKPLTKKDKEKEYFKIGANDLFTVSTAATTKTISRKRADEFAKQTDIQLIKIDPTKEDDDGNILGLSEYNLNLDQQKKIKDAVGNSDFNGVMIDTGDGPRFLVTNESEINQKSLESGDIFVGSVEIHEITHASDDALFSSTQAKEYRNNLYTEASTNKDLETAHSMTMQTLFGRTGKDANGNNVDSDLSGDAKYFDKNGKLTNWEVTSDRFKDEYTNHLQEILFSFENTFNLESSRKKESYFTRKFKKSADVSTPKKALDYLLNRNADFRSGNFSSQVLNAVNKSKKEGASKSVTLFTQELATIKENEFDYEPGEFDALVRNLEFKIKAAKKKEAAKPVEEAKPKDKTKDDTKKNEKRIGDQLKAMVPPGTTNKDFKEKVAIKVIDNIDNGMLNPLIKKIAAGYGVVADNVYGKSWDDFFIEVAGVQLKKNIMAFNPESNNDLGGYIIGSQYGVRNRVKEALAKFKKEGEGGFKEDVSVAKNVIAREDAAPQEAEKRKYTPLTKSNIVPNFTITAITDKLTKVLASLESKITAKRGDNAATTPLIAEIKKKIGKVVGDPEAAPKLVIQRLGKLKDGTYEKNLIKHKKAIIENMTTTFLMGKDNGEVVKGGIPIAIEKSVGGAFRVDEDGNRVKVTVNVGGKNVVQDVFDPKFIPYPEWIGKEIDREKTLVRGATAGNEIVRRVPADKVSDADFVGLFIDEKGKLIRGKREALGKAIGEEIAFEIFSKEIQNENSEISKAFDTNQEALGEVLADNFVTVLLKDIERGTVKFSKTYITGFDVFDNKVRNVIKYISVNNINPFSITAQEDEVFKNMMDDLKESYLEFKQKTNNDELFEGKNLTTAQKEQLKKWNKSSGISFSNYINNVADYNFSYVESILGVPHGASNLKAEGAKQAGKKTISNYYSHLVDSGIPNPQEVFLRTLRGWSVSGLKISIFGNNKSLQEFITKNKVLKNAFAGYTLEKSEKFDGLTIKTASGKKAVNPILIQEVKEDLSKTVDSGTNKVDLDGRKKLADQSVEDLKRFSEFLKNGNAGSNLGKAVILNTMSSSMRSILKTVSEVKGVMAVDGLPAFNKENKSNYTLEHGTPVKQLRNSIAYFVSDENLSYEKSVGKVVETSYTYIVPTDVSKAIDANYRDDFPGQDWVDMEEPFKARFNAKATQDLLKEKGYNQTFDDITQLNNKTVNVPKQVKFSSGFKKSVTTQSAINIATSLDYNKNPKGISVWDFDDTLATTKSNVLYTMPGEVNKVTEKEFNNLFKQKTVYYHGTSAVVDQKFVNKEIVKDFPEGASSFSVQMQGLGKHYTKSLDNAKSFIDHRNREDNTGTVAAVSISTNNPKQFKTYDELLNDIKSTVKNKDLSISERNKKYLDILKSEGFDSITYKEGPSYNPGKKSLMAEAVIPFDSAKKLIGSADYKQRNEGIVKESVVAVKQNKLNATEFALRSEELSKEGAEFDFSEFSKVMEGAEGPMFDKAIARNKKFGNDNVFILTARPADSKYAIHEFLKGIGLDVKLENIVGLGDGTAKAKADWMIGKVTEGYNDFYFADDAIKNVSAVKDVFDNFDVKGKVQQAKVKFSTTLSTKFNQMIERKTGLPTSDKIEKMAGRQMGKGKGRFKVFISPSAEDFRGLTQYVFAGKGKQGEADQKFFEEALMDPYFKGVSAIEAANVEMKTELKALYKKFKGIKNKLKKNTENKNFTNDQAVRVYLWTKAGYKIPGISKQEQKTLNETVKNDEQLLRFAESLLISTKKEKWGKPNQYWDTQTLLNDIQTLTEKINRKEYIKEFIQNADLIFSEQNLNKVEAAFGASTRNAIEDSLYAMKTGSNRTVGQNQIDNKWMNWLNNSIGSIMFFNRKSALLQTLSVMNFINWHDNNPAKSALAFANQPQFWKDFAFLFNSPKLKERRGGLKSDIQEAEIANAARGSKNKASAALSYLLKIGFTPTQIADSFAIAAGGATFYRNRINTYLKEVDANGEKVYTKKQAEEKAFLDFSKTSDISQQSGDPALVSQQQRSIAGRLILAFQNYPMQSARIQKKSAQDLLNRRGDPKEHLSKILYYGAMQSLLFNTLSNGLFTLFPGFDNEDDEEKIKKNSEKRINKAMKGMIDSAIRGTGIYGAVGTTIKNTYKMYVKQEERGSFKADHAYTLLEGLNLSPQIGSKAADFYSAIQTRRFNKKVIEKHPWSITIDGKFNPSPNYDIAGSLASSFFNLPLDRMLVEAKGVAEMLDKRNTQMQRLFLALGFRAWDVNAPNEEFELIKEKSKSGGLKIKKIKVKQTIKVK